MTAGEFKEIAEAMQKYGILRYKVGGTEICRESSVLCGKTPATELSPSVAGDPYKDLPDGIPPDPNKDPIKHKVEQMASLLKLSDQELLDQMFPDIDAHKEEHA